MDISHKPEAAETSAPTRLEVPAWGLDMKMIVIFLAALALFFTIYADALAHLARQWNNREEYSHGFLIPLISAFLVWQKKDVLARIDFEPSWLGFFLLLIALLVYAAGTLSTLYVVIHYSLLLTVFALALAFAGLRIVRIVWAAFVFLVFMIPLPPFLYNNLSQHLQLISSDLGVAFVRWFGISVYLEGNVIDLGNYKLQVVEACNGLRYLFPLMSFGFLAAYFFQAPLWARLVIFISTVPITVFMNSFRIGIIGLLVDRFGTEQAEGFLHDFEGWVIFMACCALLVVEMWILARVMSDKRSFRDIFFLDFPASRASEIYRPRTIHITAIASLITLVMAAVWSSVSGERKEVIPERTPFSAFPTEIGQWRGQKEKIDEIYLPSLDLTDYVLVNYQGPTNELVNYYVAYYESQRAGASAHSPRACIPGGGWKIEDLRTIQLDEANSGGYEANRVQIAMGDNRQLVYYWFEQRGRIITNEYLVKWYLFWDALTRNRSDGALVRVTTPVAPDETWEDGGRRLNDFISALGNRLSEFVPE